MMLVVTHDLLSQFINRQLNITTKEKAKTAEKLSSGYRINRSADDAAGLKISEKMRSQVRGLQRASKNIQDAISLCQVADGALNETHSILQRMRELSIQAANDTNQSIDRDAIQAEIDALTEEVDRVANDTSFNKGIYPLLGVGSFKNSGGSGKIPTGNGYCGVSNMKLTTENYQNLSKYIWTDGLYEYFDFYVHLDGKNHTLEMYTLDGTLIFKGECNQANYPWGPLSEDYKGTAYEIIATLDTPNNYLNQGTIQISWYFDDEVTVDEADRFFRNAVFSFELNNAYELTVKIYQPPGNGSWNVNINNGQAPIWIQMGANSGQGMFLSLVDATAKSLGITDPPLDVMDYANANISLTRLDVAINRVSSYRTHFGVQQNRLEYAKSVDDNTAENTQAAESRIRDADMAKETVDFSKHSILEQAGQSMLAQANQSTQGILSLFQ